MERDNSPLLLPMAACVPYLLFCLLVLTPANDVVILWPYMLMVFTEPLHGLNAGDFVSIAIADVIGLVLILAILLPLGRMRWLREHRGASVVLGALSWPVLLFAFQFAVWVIAGFLGWPTGI